MADSVDKMMNEQGLPIDYVLVDGPHKPRTMNKDLPCEAIVKGDSKCHCIAAASIIAKVFSFSKIIKFFWGQKTLCWIYFEKRQETFLNVYIPQW